MQKLKKSFSDSLAELKSVRSLTMAAMLLAIALFGLGLPSLVFTILAIVFLVKFVGNRKQVKELQARANGAAYAPQYPNNR